MIRARQAVASGLIGALALAACGSSSANSATKETIGDCPAAAVPVVVSVDQWGNIVHQLAGDCGEVTTVFKSSSADPHDYEPTPADNAKFTGAKLVVVNGLGYDSWADKVIATLDRKPSVVNSGDVVGLGAGDNPHLWYGPDYVYEVADAITAQLEQLAPDAASYFEQRHDAWRDSMRDYDADIVKISSMASGKTYGATEGIFDYMAEKLGLTDETPTGFQRTTANDSEPAPGDVNDFEQALADGKIVVLIYNTQTEGSVPEEVRAKAEAAKVPVVNVSESVPPQFSTFESWQVSQLEALATALGA